MDAGAETGVFGKHGHESEDVDALQIEVIASPQLQLMVETEGNALNFEICVDQHELFVLPVALQHGNVLNISIDLDVSLVKLKARVKVTTLGNWIYLFDFIISLIVTAAIFGPGEEHRMMKGAN